MNFDHVDFTQKCHIDLGIAGYGDVSGMGFDDRNTLSLMEIFFKESSTWKNLPEYKRYNYVTGFISPSDARFRAFMNDGVEAARNEFSDLIKGGAFPLYSTDFWYVWQDNQITEVKISFPLSSPQKME